MVDFTWKPKAKEADARQSGQYHGDSASEKFQEVLDVDQIGQQAKANIQDRLSRKNEPQAGQKQETAPEVTQETAPNAPTPQKQTSLLNIALAGLMQGIARAALGTPEPGTEKTPDQPQAGMPAYNPVQTEKAAPTQGMNADVLAQAREAAMGAREQVQKTDQSASPDAAKASRQNAGHEQAKREASNQQQR